MGVTIYIVTITTNNIYTYKYQESISITLCIYIFLLVIWSSMANFTTTFILHSVIPWNNTDTKAFALIVRWWLILLQTMQSVHRDTQTLNYFGWLLLFKNRQHCLPSKEIAVFVQQWHLPLSNSYKIWLRVNKSFCLKYILIEYTGVIILPRS